jgi:hypothetical protein
MLTRTQRARRLSGALSLDTGCDRGWDNRSTSHFGPVDGPHLKQQRVVHRTTVGADLRAGPDGLISRPLVGELFNTIS